MLQEWNKTNTDISSLLVGWSASDPTPCSTVWVGIVCTEQLLNITDNNVTEPPTRTYFYEISVVGLYVPTSLFKSYASTLTGQYLAIHC